MGERYTYEPEEVRDAARYLDQQVDLLLHSHAANWRKKFIGFVEEMTLRFECLKLLTTLLGGNRNIDAKAWFEKAGAGDPPPLPEAPYDAMALVWLQIGAAVKQQGEGFVSNAAVDWPYVLSCGFAGGSLGEKYHDWLQGFLVPFTELLRAWMARITERMPQSGTFDLWDLALEVVNGAPPAGSRGGGEDGATGPAGPTSAKPAAKPKASARRRKAEQGGGTTRKAKKGTKKGRPTGAGKKGKAKPSKKK